MNKKVMLGVLFGFILLAMLAMAIAGKSRFPLINGVVTAVVLPAENAITALGNTGDDVRSFWKSLTVMQDENARLKQENAELRSANIQMATLFAENQQLRALLNYKEQHKTQQVVAAKVIARNFGDLRDCIYIDKGRDAGLAADMAVVNGGLVGIVDEVYDGYARVLLLTSPRCRVGARVLRADSRAIGVAGGSSGGDKLILEHVYREASLREGDVIVTSGYSGSHPADILIGKITATHMDIVGLVQEADVTAAADIADVEQVLVIIGFTPEPKIVLQGGQAK